MLDMVKSWYNRRFSDPHAVSLIVILTAGFLVIYFFGHLLAPLLVAIVLAYLLEWPVNKLMKLNLPRLACVGIVVFAFIGLLMVGFFFLVPTVWKQIIGLITDVPNMYSAGQHYISTLPKRYPEIADMQLLEAIMDNTRDKVLGLGENILKGSMASLLSIATLAIYLILVPLLVFFLLKDKEQMLNLLSRVMPRNRRLADMVWVEMHDQISNYIRGKVLEIFIVGIASYITFALLDLRYAVLLAISVGFSVLIPYIGAAAVSVPVILVALFQWGVGPDFYYLLFAYGIIQAIDGNVLVPILFSEAVNLHPVVIIIAVLVFGGLWGFWGVFFAIPLATLVKAVFNAFPNQDVIETKEVLEQSK